MRAFESLGRRGQIGRLRRLGQAALARYGLEGARLALLRHQHNTTFRVDAPGGPYVLRVNRPGTHTPATIGSEMAWLRALRDEAGLGVPDPVVAIDGATVVLATAPGVPGPRACVLLRRLDGRFADARLAPAHMRRVARLQAALHDHAEAWTPPAGFARPRLDMLTTEAKSGAIAPGADDRERCLALVAGLTAGAGVVAAALDEAAAAGDRDARLIHGDLHQENYLFRGAEALAIDFDDCGWGSFLYDLAVTLFEIEDRPSYEQLRDALLDEYAAHRPLPAGAADRLRAFGLLRRVQMLMWVLESRSHPAFRDHWETSAADCVRDLSEALA